MFEERNLNQKINSLGTDKDLSDIEFENCVFEKCDFSGVDLSEASLVDCEIVGCNFGTVKLDNCRFQNVVFKKSKVVGIDFSVIDNFLLDFSFEECVIKTCSFSRIKKDKWSFFGSEILDTYFTAFNLQAADFRKTNLEATRFIDCDLQGADFSEARNYEIDPQKNNIKKAKFMMPEAMSLLNNFEIELL